MSIFKNLLIQFVVADAGQYTNVHRSLIFPAQQHSQRRRIKITLRSFD